MRERGLAAIRDVALIAAISAGLFAVLEAGVRAFAPQSSETTFVQGESLGLDDEILGHVNRPGAVARHESPEFSVEYRIGPDGLRDAARHPTPKPPGVFRVLLVGDSFAFGSAVNYGDMFGVVAERRLEDSDPVVEIVKAGVSGYDTRRDVLWIERLLPRYEADLVVLAFLPNDLFTNRALDAPFEGPGKDLTVRFRAEKATTLHVVALGKRILMSDDRLYVRLYGRTPRREYFALPMSDRLAEQIAVTKELLRSAGDVVRAAGVPLVVLSIPQQFQTLVRAGGFAPKGVDVDFIDRVFGELAEANGFEWISMLPELADTYREAGRDLYYRYDGHLTPFGNEVVGERLARIIRASLAGAGAAGR